MTKIKHRIKSNDGNSISIIGMMVIIISCIVGIFITDISKNVYVKNMQQHNAQMATQTALKHQDKQGGLTIDAVNTVINEYMKQNKNSSNNRKLTACQAKGNYPHITVSFAMERKNGMDFDTANSFTSFAGKELTYTSVERKRFHMIQSALGKYKVVSVKVVDSVGNIMMGVVGQPCTEITTYASSVSTSTYDEEG